MSDTLETKTYKVYPYRWVVLIVYLLTAMMIQALWATFFSTTTQAMAYYGVGESAISLLSIIFMVGMIVLSVPSMAAFEKWGFKKAVGFGAALMGICGLLRGIFGQSYIALVITTVGFAVAQPFILNAPGLVAGKWFPENERATANSMGMLSNYLGMALALILTPVFLDQGLSIKTVLIIYGIAGAVAAVLFLIFAKDAPPTPPCAEEVAVRSDFKEGFKSAFKNKGFLACIIIFFFLFGIFNVFFTLIEPILKDMSNGAVDSTRSGIIGVLILVVAIVGSVVLSMISDKDKLSRRVPYLAGSNILGLVGLILFIVLHSYAGMIVAAVLYGLFTIGSAPLILTLAAEEAYPTSEGTSEGVMMWVGNIGGAILIALSGLFKSHMTLMIIIVVLSALCDLAMFFIKEKKLQK